MLLMMIVAHSTLPVIIIVRKQPDLLPSSGWGLGTGLKRCLQLLKYLLPVVIFGPTTTLYGRCLLKWYWDITSETGINLYYLGGLTGFYIIGIQCSY